MTDDELNEIFRAIRHRRTLSWKTIEKLAMEVRELRKPKEKPSATFRWNADVAQFNPILDEHMKRIRVSSGIERERALFEALTKGILANNVDPSVCAHIWGIKDPENIQVCMRCRAHKPIEIEKTP